MAADFDAKADEAEELPAARLRHVKPALAA
jgi:hypothetical protein